MNRKVAPDIKTIQQLSTKFPESNGNVYHIKQNEGVFKLEIIFPNAGFATYHNKFDAIYGLDLILSGTATKTAHKISEEIDTLGGFVFKTCDYYNACISIYGANHQFSSIVKLVKEAIDGCIYNEKELEIYKNKKLSERAINLEKPSFLASRGINHLILGTTHPFSLSSTEDLIKSISSIDLKNYHSNSLDNYSFIFAGSENFDIITELNHLGFKTETTEIAQFKETIVEKTTDEERIKKDNATQNAIRFGKILPNRAHKDYFKLQLSNLILGGYFGSRLMKNIREEKGLTYGIFSSITPFRDFSILKISCECNSTLSETVYQEIINEINLMKTQLVGEEELKTAKNYLLGALMRNFDGPFNVSERLKTHLDLMGDSDYYDRYVAAVNAITSEEIIEIMNNFFDFNSLKYCISGDI